MILAAAAAVTDIIHDNTDYGALRNQRWQACIVLFYLTQRSQKHAGNATPNSWT